MPLYRLKLAGRAIKKVLSVSSILIGGGSVSAVSAGASVTGELILDAVIILGCLIIIAINGKDGVPDWLIRLVGDKVEDKE